MKILITSASLLPNYGGPAFSISRLAIALADAGNEVGLWTSDRSVAITPLLTGSSVRRIVGTESEALNQFGRVDILHDNGIWLPYNHRFSVLAKERGIARVVSTRGMLEPWAFRHKQLKKRAAWHLYQRRDLMQACCHHATAETEARNLRHLQLEIPIVTIPNGVDLPSKQYLPLNGPRRTALFLGRICPIKGLPMLVEAWARVRPKGWFLRIAGPDEGCHRAEIQRIILAAGLDKDISFIGFVTPQMKQFVFAQSEVFILPSYSESFGMAVAEALAHGLPVLTTTGTPWSILQTNGCGWSVRPAVDALAEALRVVTNLTRDDLREMGANGRALVVTQFSWKHIVDRVLSMYESVVRRAVA